MRLDLINYLIEHLRTRVSLTDKTPVSQVREMGSDTNVATAAEAHINEVSGPRDGTHTHTNEQTNYGFIRRKLSGKIGSRIRGSTHGPHSQERESECDI